MKHLLFTAGFYCLFLVSCAQQKNTVRGYAFYRENIPGREPRSIDGAPVDRPRDTLRMIYLELGQAATPKLDSVVYFGANAAAALYPLAPTELFIGTKKADGSRVELRPGTGKSWWRVELDANDTRGRNGRKGRILVVGREGEKPFRVELVEETELEPEIRG
jgi:hypothetical protein